MDNQKYVEFRKKRDVGAIISDTITFLAREWQPLLSVILKVSIIPIILAVVAGVYYTAAVSGFMDGINNPYGYGDDPFEDVFDFANFGIPLFIFLIAYILVYAVISISTFSYIKSYANNRGVVNFEQISLTIKEKFWPFIGMSLVNGLIIGVGYVFCFLPGIYFTYVLVLSYGILIFNNMGAMDSINESFKMIKGHWWNTFGVLLLVGIILGVISFIFSLPITLMDAADNLEYVTEPEPDAIIPFMNEPLYLILLIITYVVDFILYGVRMVSTAFIYFDIEEQENPTTPDIIDTIGSN